MKKLILSIALIAGLTAVSDAQNSTSPTGTKGERMKNASPQDRAKHDANKAEKELGLNADQKAKWEAAALERINANQPIREKMKGATTPEERKSFHSQVKANNDKFETAVNGFLTPDQKTKFEKMKSDRKSKRMEDWDHDGTGGSGGN